LIACDYRTGTIELFLPARSIEGTAYERENQRKTVPTN
jgi:hypothetical protein